MPSMYRQQYSNLAKIPTAKTPPRLRHRNHSARTPTLEANALGTPPTSRPKYINGMKLTGVVGTRYNISFGLYTVPMKAQPPDGAASACAISRFRV